MLWEGGLHMNLRQINELWNEYKEKYDLPKDVQISAVQYDAEKYVEGFFNILELLDGKYILHLNPRFHLLQNTFFVLAVQGIMSLHSSYYRIIHSSVQNVKTSFQKNSQPVFRLAG